MSNFTKGQQVKIKDDIARHLETTVGTWDNDFKGLVGLVGTLDHPAFFATYHWQFVATDGRQFSVLESELEAVQP